MRKLRMVGIVTVGLMAALVVVAQGFKVYPGAKKFTPPETEESKEAAKMAPGVVSTIYLTDESFDKVAVFYRGIGKEYTMPEMAKGGKLPSGQEIHMTFFIFDGAPDLKQSKNWLKVQRPYIGSVDFQGGAPEYKDVKDVTSIQLVEKKE